MVDASYMADEVADAFGGPSFATLMTLLVLILVVFVASTMFAFWRVLSPKGQTILIVGPSNAGKTALFMRLREGDKVTATVASMQENQGTFELRVAPGAKGTRTVQLVDVPGHPRVRGGFQAHLSAARGVVFVLDSVDFLPHKTEIAEQLYEVLAHRSVAGRRLPVLLAANKSDAGIKAHTVDFIRKRLERELEQLQATRGTLALTDGSGPETLLVKSGDPVTFEAISRRGAKVSLGSISATHGEVQPVLEFISRCIPP